MDFLSVLAHWHSPWKLCLHSEKTLKIFENVSKGLCFELQACACYTSVYNGLETRKEKEASQCHESKKKTNTGKAQKGKSREGFSSETYKICSSPDYVVAILEFGTTDSYSTQIEWMCGQVGEFHSFLCRGSSSNIMSKDYLSEQTRRIQPPRLWALLKHILSICLYLMNVMNHPCLFASLQHVHIRGYSWHLHLYTCYVLPYILHI